MPSFRCPHFLSLLKKIYTIPNISLHLRPLIWAQKKRPKLGGAFQESWTMNKCLIEHRAFDINRLAFIKTDFPFNSLVGRWTAPLVGVNKIDAAIQRWLV